MFNLKNKRQKENFRVLRMWSLKSAGIMGLLHSWCNPFFFFLSSIEFLRGWWSGSNGRIPAQQMLRP
jgi:hypothetical protein